MGRQWVGFTLRQYWPVYCYKCVGDNIMRYYKLSYKHRMLPNSTLAQDQRTYAPESLRRHLLHTFRSMADNARHVRVDVATDPLGVPVSATVWHKLTSTRTGLWCVWERVRIVRM